MLIREKVNQAVQLLREFDIDCWITFTRESEVNGDPVLPFLAPGDVTWHSAFIISKDGRARTHTHENRELGRARWVRRAAADICALRRSAPTWVPAHSLFSEQATQPRIS